MNIEVSVFGLLRKKMTNNNEGKFVKELPENSTVEDLLMSLGLNSEPSLLIMVNDCRISGRDLVLHNLDKVSIMPVVVGG